MATRKVKLTGLGYWAKVFEDNRDLTGFEDALKDVMPAVSNAMVIGDKRKFLSVLLTLQVEVDSETGMPTNKLTGHALETCKPVALALAKVLSTTVMLLAVTHHSFCLVLVVLLPVELSPFVLQFVRKEIRQKLIRQRCKSLVQNERRCRQIINHGGKNQNLLSGRYLFL